jgi:hypothetical protein
MKKTVIILHSIALIVLFNPIIVNAEHNFWTNRHISEENPPLNCPDNRLVTGIHCEGAYCDNIRLRCSGSPLSSVGSFNTGFREWTTFISEETPYGTCAMKETQNYYPGSNLFYGVITGLSCKGKYCDDISLECSAIMNNGPNFSYCYWHGPVSEEDGGSLLFPDNYYAIALYCQGKYCDDKWFYVCPLLN